MKATNAEKSNVREWLAMLDEASRGKHYPKLWKRVHRLAASPTRKKIEVNLSKIEKNTKEGDNVVVPGKVLSTGSLGHKVNIAAMEFSESALKSLGGSGCRIMSIKEMLGEKNIRIIV
ncbi:MAG: 50S ribosomal protein L18e [Candidatus Micrarchaeota archaeon]|nr:50S ribosomal protein L18e [Candidatus Micrarchaeota archaeon]